VSRAGIAGVVVALAIATAIRVPRLDLRPVHGDEAVHAYKFNEILIGNGYRYDPVEFHGPTLNYFTLPVAWLRGADDYSQLEISDFRIVTVVFGIALILLLPLVADGLGRSATACAGLWVAISPLVGFCSRYYVQETLLVFFTFATIACGWRCTRAGIARRWPRAGWAVLGGASAGLMHATKETCLISWGAMGVAFFFTLWIRGAHPQITVATWGGRHGGSAGASASNLGGAYARDVSLALAVAAAVSVTFYSSLFTNWQGPIDSLRAVAVYLSRGIGESPHTHPWYYYLKMLGYTHHKAGPIWSEGLIVGLAGVGLVAAMRRPGKPAEGRDASSAARGDAAFVRFLAIYTVVMIAVYSALPYKTPWSMFGFVHGLTLLAGVGAVTLLRWLRYRPARITAGLLMLAAAVQLGVQSLRTNLDPRFVADHRNPYVYAHPLRGVEAASEFVAKLAAIHPDHNSMLVKVIMPNAWPMPWYFRSMHHVGYWEHPPDDCDAPVIITATDAPNIADRLSGDYDGPWSYSLRPDVSLIMYVEADLMRRFVESQDADGLGAKSALLPEHRHARQVAWPGDSP
jgi:uncharacterized protein (TIGR03663 family)